MLAMTYRNARARVFELAATLGAAQLQAPVPATPEWTAHEVLAHLVGCAADAASWTDGRSTGCTVVGPPRRGAPVSFGW